MAGEGKNDNHALNTLTYRSWTWDLPLLGEEMKYFSMFSGIGGFELGIQCAYMDMWDRKTEVKKPTSSEQSLEECKQSLGIVGNNAYSNNRPSSVCVGFSEVNKYAIQVYEHHFKGHTNYGDATRIVPEELPNFDFLCGGFPCQAFSIAGKRGGFDDTRGTLFFEIARILKVKRPQMFLLENVKGLLSHDNGRTFKTIITTLAELGYGVEWQVLNSKDFGVPQNRERVFIVGHLGGIGGGKVFPIEGVSQENNGQDCSTAIDASYFKGIDNHGQRTAVMAVPTKFLDRNQKNYQGEYSFTVDTVGTGGVMRDMRIRRLTPTECERLQGFPDGWTSILSDSQRYKCLGNAVTVNVIESIINEMRSLPNQ